MPTIGFIVSPEDRQALGNSMLPRLFFLECEDVRVAICEYDPESAINSVFDARRLIVDGKVTA